MTNLNAAEMQGIRVYQSRTLKLIAGQAVAMHAPNKQIQPWTFRFVQIVQFNSKPRRYFDPAQPPVLFEEDLESEEKW